MFLSFVPEKSCRIESVYVSCIIISSSDRERTNVDDIMTIRRRMVVTMCHVGSAIGAVSVVTTSNEKSRLAKH